MTISTPTKPPNFDVVAELQRQGRIISAASEAAEARGEQTPASGMPGYERWARQMLVQAGETYTVIRGEKIPLYTVPFGAIPSGLPYDFSPPATVAELLEAAAVLVELNGWHRGADWTEVRFGVAVYYRAVRGQGALFLAAGFNPHVLTRPQFTPPPLVRQAEEALAAYLMVRGEAPRFDSDGFLDPDAVIEGYEADLLLARADLVQMWRDAAEHVRACDAR